MAPLKEPVATEDDRPIRTLIKYHIHLHPKQQLLTCLAKTVHPKQPNGTKDK
jgi:hypothetical protein